MNPQSTLPNATPKPPRRYGLKVLAQGTSPLVEYVDQPQSVEHANINQSIVAIHGLEGDREDSWTADGKLWLKDFLPESVSRARIMTWGWDGYTSGIKYLTHQALFEHSRQLLANLSTHRMLDDVRYFYLPRSSLSSHVIR